jgi:hypothetical protein
MFSHNHAIVSVQSEFHEAGYIRNFKQIAQAKILIRIIRIPVFADMTLEDFPKTDSLNLRVIYINFNDFQWLKMR